MDRVVQAVDNRRQIPVVELLTGDGVHPNDAGHAAIAGVFDLDLFRE